MLLLATIAGLAQPAGTTDSMLVGLYPLGKSAVKTLPYSSVTAMIEWLESLLDSNKVMYLEPRYDSVRVSKGDLNDPLNDLIGQYRGKALAGFIRNMGFREDQVLVLPAKRGPRREVTIYVAPRPTIISLEEIVVLKNRTNNLEYSTGALGVRVSALERWRDSVNAATKNTLPAPSGLEEFASSFGVGGGVIGRAGAHIPYGVNFFFQLGRLELGWMGGGGNVGQQGHTPYFTFAIPISGDNREGVDVIVIGLCSFFAKNDKDLYMAPYRNYIFPGLGAGFKLKFMAGIPFQVTITGQYQPQMYWDMTGISFPVQSGSMMVKIAALPLSNVFGGGQ